MIEEYCRIYYNIGLNLQCGLAFYNCMCPDITTFKYLCYQICRKLKRFWSEGYTAELQETEVNLIVESVALALTEKAIYGNNELKYISMVDAFNTRHFRNHFMSLAEALMKAFQQKKDTKLLLKRLSECLCSIYEIFDNRKRIGEQILHYYKMIYTGLEKANTQKLEMESVMWNRQCNFINQKTGEA